jgi:hypothetical protein
VVTPISGWVKASISVEPHRCDPVIGGQSEVIVSVSLPLPLEPPSADAGDRPTLPMTASPRTIRIRRAAPSSGERSWLLDLEIDVPVPDPEQVLADAEGFLVDETGGRELGVVDRVEVGADGVVSALIVSRGWFGRRRGRGGGEGGAGVGAGGRRGRAGRPPAAGAPPPPARNGKNSSVHTPSRSR